MKLELLNSDGSTVPLTGQTVTSPVNLRLTPATAARSIKVTAQEFSAADAATGSSIGTSSSVCNLAGAPPPPPLPAGQGVTGFALYNTSNLLDIRPMKSADSIDLDVQTGQFSIRAVVPNHMGIGSVVVNLDGQKNPENTEPYSARGDHNPLTLAVGAHTITAQAFSGLLGAGTPVGPLATMTFQVVKSAVPPPPPPPPPTGTVTPPPAPGTWKLIYADEFDGSVNPLARGYVLKMWGKDGMGQEIDDPAMVAQANSILTLTAKRMADGRIHSGEIHSGGDLAMSGKIPPLCSLRFGYIEARVKLPTTIGMWPAFWMMPTPNPGFHDGDGEIDIFDNGGSSPTSATGAVQLHAHFGHDHYAELGGDWHTIGLEWNPTYLQWYVDGKPVLNMRTTLSPQTASYFILGLQVNDGAWGPAPAASWVGPDQFQVDYVRWWQKA